MKTKITDRARQVLTIEAGAVKEQLKHLDGSFIKAAELIDTCRGKLIIMGVGKSGLIGRKLSATFSSLGISSVSVHPADLSHGDFGTLSHGDVVLILSYSGESEDLKRNFPTIRKMGLKTILMAGRQNSLLAKSCDVFLNVSVKREACPYNLAPTASTTAMLALGDALALGISHKRGFRKEDFAKYHPGGNLGRKLTLMVSELMHKGDNNPVIKQDATVKQALFVMTKKKLGATSVTDSRGKLVGYFTDGDLRRRLQEDRNLLSRKLSSVMTKKPKTLKTDTLAADAAEMLKKYNCDNFPVVDGKGKPVGMIDERDLIAAGMI